MKQLLTTIIQTILDPTKPANALATHARAMKLARQVFTDGTSRSKLVRAILDLRQIADTELNRPFLAAFKHQPVLAVNARNAINADLISQLMARMINQSEFKVEQFYNDFYQLIRSGVQRQKQQYDAMLEGKINNLIHQLKHGDNTQIANLIQDYSPFGAKGTENLAKSVENEQWSMLAMALIHLESAINAFKNLGFKITPLLKRKIFAKYFKVSAATGKSLIRRKHGKIIQRHYDSEFAKVTRTYNIEYVPRAEVNKRIQESTFDFVVSELEKVKVFKPRQARQIKKAAPITHLIYED